MLARRTCVMHVADLVSIYSVNGIPRHAAPGMKGAVNWERRKRFSRPYITMLRGTKDLSNQVNFWHARWHVGKMEERASSGLKRDLVAEAAADTSRTTVDGAGGGKRPRRKGPADWLGVLPSWQQGSWTGDAGFPESGKRHSRLERWTRRLRVLDLWIE